VIFARYEDLLTSPKNSPLNTRIASAAPSAPATFSEDILINSLKNDNYLKPLSDKSFQHDSSNNSSKPEQAIIVFIYVWQSLFSIQN
jgi:hypothetical protein